MPSITPQQDRDGDRGEHQQHGRRQPVEDEGQHRRLADGREAEIEGQQLAHVDEELLDRRPVEPELAPQLVDELRRRVPDLPGEDVRRVARRQDAGGRS